MSSDGNWYVECFGNASEQVAALLAAQGEAGASESVSLLDNKGNRHDVYFIDSRYVSVLKQMKKEKPDIFARLQFFIQNTPGGVIHPAAFVEKKRPSVGVRKALSDLELKRKRR